MLICEVLIAFVEVVFAVFSVLIFTAAVGAIAVVALDILIGKRIVFQSPWFWAALAIFSAFMLFRINRRYYINLRKYGPERTCTASSLSHGSVDLPLSRERSRSRERSGSRERSRSRDRRQPSLNRSGRSRENSCEQQYPLQRHSPTRGYSLGHIRRY